MMGRAQLLRRWMPLPLVLSGLVFLAACGGGGGTPPPPTLSITTTTLGDGVVGEAYAQTLTSTGGQAPVTWGLAASSGPLPTPLVINSSTGVISGTPDTAGTFNFSVQVQDSATPAQVATKAFTITIASPPLVITTLALSDGVVGEVYSQTLTSTGGLAPVTWGLAVSSGPLPTPLVINPTSGVISGTPDTAGTFNIIVEVQDAATPTQVVTKSFTITIAAPPSGRNDTIANATPLTNGRFAASLSPYGDPDTVRNPDEDFYEITATAGATVTIEIFAKRLLPASLLDSMIQIMDVNGTLLSTCRNQGNDDGVTGAPDPTPLAFDDVCFNDDITLGIVQDSYLELEVQAGATTFYVRVLSWGGWARPDFLYEIEITVVNPPPMSATVEMPGILYTPADVTIQQGGTVTWQNTDDVQHSATSDDGFSFDTGIFNPGQQRTVTFNTAGSFPYHCIVHGFAMTGTVTVVAN